MNLTLNMIAERLTEKVYTAVLHQKDMSVYSCVKLYKKGALTAEPDTLYVSEQIPDSSFLEKAAGLVVPVRETSITCNAIFLETSLSLTEILNDILSIFYEIQNCGLQLGHLMLCKSGLQEMVTLMEKILGNPIYVINNSFKVLAMCGSENMRELSANWRHMEDVGYLPYSTIQNLIHSDELNSMENYDDARYTDSKYFYTPFINYNLKYKNISQGHFFVIGMMKPISKGDIDIVNQCGPYIREAVLSRQEGFFSKERRYEDFMMDILRGKLTDMNFMQRRLEDLGFQASSTYVLVKIRPVNQHEIIFNYIAKELEKINNSRPIIAERCIITIVLLNHYVTLPRLLEILDGLCAEYSCKIGISDIFNGYHQFSLHYQQAYAALEIGAIASPLLHIYCFTDYLLPFVFKSLEKNNLSLRVFISREYSLLTDYDKENNTEYVKTLHTYILHSKNVIHTANALHIHRNTLNYRLNKIEDIGYLSLKDNMVLLRFWVSQNIISYTQTTQYNEI